MTKKTKLIAAIALALATQSAMAAFEFGGYLRSGSGSGSQNGGPTCFRLNGDSALGAGNIGGAGRLGNECDTYGELKLGTNTGDADGTKFGVHTLVAYGTQQVADWEQSVPAWREDYATAEGFGDGAFKKATVWVGKRYYNRKDVHIVDFFWLQVTGPGAGIENVDVGIGKFSYANMRNENAGYVAPLTGTGTNPPDLQNLLRATTAANPTTQMVNHDLRLEGINIGAAGSLGFGANFVSDNNSSSSGATNANGWSAWANQSVVIGTVQNGLILQVAHGEGSLDGSGNPWWGSNKNHDAWRVIDAANFEFGEHVNGQAFFAYGKEKFDWFKAEKTSTSIVIRPVYHFTDVYSLAVELGHSQVTGDTADIAGGTNHLDKLTIAPQLSMGSGFYARPVLRAYYTMANWNQGGASACTGRDCGVGLASFANSTSGSSYGFQMEAWW